MNLEDTPSIVIPCTSIEALKNLVDLLYENEILTDETVRFLNCPENLLEILNKVDFFEPVEIGGMTAVRGFVEQNTEDLL
jgi:hypothetical protein